MTFANAIQSLRAGKCAKTTAMRGYVKREDHTPVTFKAATDLVSLVPEFSPASSYSAGDHVKVTDTSASPQTATVYRFNQSHSGAWNADHADAATSLYAVTFVENDDYVDPDSKSQYPFLAAVVGSETKWFAQYAESGDKPLVVDPELWRLLLSSDWSVYDTSEVQEASTSTERW